MTTKISYDARFAARLPSEMPELIAAAASRAFISPSAYLRQALAEKLARDGFPLRAVAPTQRQAA